MLKLFKIITFTLLLSTNVLADSDISKLNSLYLNGVINKDAYFKSMNGLGINTSNEIFENLFDLFSNNVLDLSSYESSLENLQIVSNTNNTNNSLEKSSQALLESPINSNLKTYFIENCKGDSTLCKDFSGAPVSFEFIDSKVNIVESSFDELLKDPSLLKISQIKSFVKNDDFDIIVSVLHVRGFIIDFVFGGVMENNQFEMVDATIKGNGTELVSAKLSD